MMPRPGTQALVVSRADKIYISALFASSLVRNNILKMSFQKVRDELIKCFADGILDEEEFVFLYDA